MGDERQLGQILRTFQFFNLRAQGRRRNKHLLEGADLARLQITVWQPSDPNCQFNVIGHQVQRLITKNRIDFALRVALDKRRNGWHHDTDAVIKRRRQLQRAAWVGDRLGEFIERIFRLAQDARTAQIKSLPGLGELHFARGAHQQRSPELLFKPRHLLAHHRLGDTKALGGGGE